MSKFLKAITTFVVLCLAMVGLTSCSSYNLYEDWKDLGANIEKDHPFEDISISDVEKKIEADDTFVLLIVTKQDSASISKMSTLYEQSYYLEYDDDEYGKIYVLNAVSLLESVSDRATIASKCQVKKYQDVNGDFFVTACYVKGETLVDTSDIDNDETDRFLANKQDSSSTSTSVKYEAVASFIYVDFPKLYIAK